MLQVGLGPHGRNWARQVLPDIKEVDVQGFVDTDPNALDLLRQEANIPAGRCFESLREAIAEVQPEAVLITTALPSHAPVIRAALEAGLHVLVEKPFAPNLDTARELVELAEAKDRILMVSQNYRFFPATRVVAELLEGGSLGGLYQVAIDFRRDSPLRRGRPARHHSDEQPLLVDMSVHHFDLLRMLLRREPDSVSCRSWNPPWSPFSGPPVAHANVAFGDAQVSYRGSWLSSGPATPWAGEWRMEFEGGSVHWTSRGDRGKLADRVVVRERRRRPRVLPLPDMRIDRWGTLTEFATAIRERREPEASGRDNLGTIAFMLAAVDSARRGQPVDVAPARPEAALP